MPVFTIKDRETGRSLTVKGDSAPTEEEAAQLFSQSAPAPQEKPFVPELVAGSEEQMQAARARNLQGSMGLAEPVSPNESIGLGDRAIASFAPTPEEKKAYYETEYGKGSFMPVSEGTALVRIPDGKGGKKWVVDNPKGLDVGDVAALAGNLPQIIAGTTAALAMAPTPAGSLAKVAQTSGIAATASGAVGAAQDLLYRFLTNQPWNTKEVMQRRGLQSLADFAMGTGVTAGANKVAATLGERSAAKNFLSQFIKEGDEAKARLVAAGVNPRSAVEAGDAVRALQPTTATADQAGNAIADVLNAADESVRKQSQTALGQAAGYGQRQVDSLLQAATSAPVGPVTAGQAAIGGAKQTALAAKTATDKLLNEAMDEIAADAKNAGLGKSIIKLTNTNKAIGELRGNLLKDAEGNASDLYSPLLGTMDKISQVAGTAQELPAVRQLRTMLGSKINGQSDVFPGLDVGVAKKLYRSLSQDIEDSVASFSGNGAAKLKAYNAAYKALIEPTEANSFASKLVNGGFDNPEDVIHALARGGTEDWAAAKKFIPPNTYMEVRRAVADKLIGGTKMTLGGAEVSDLSQLGRSLSAMPDEVKNEVFGNTATWKSLQKLSDQFDFMAARRGLFEGQALPKMNAISEAMAIAKSEGYDAANAHLRRAMEAAASRRDNIAQSLMGQLRSGNTKAAVENPDLLFHSLIFSGKYPPATVKGILDKLPAGTREDVAKVAFQTLWENARSVAQSTVSKSANTYSLEGMLKQVFGSKAQRDTMEEVLGAGRFGLVKDWTSYMMKLAAEQGSAGKSARSLTSLIAVAPYQNLFAARATATALDTAAGHAFIRTATPESAVLFSDARRALTSPKKTAAGIAAIQQAMNLPGFDDYRSIMKDLNPQQQEAVDAYLTGR